MRVDIRQHPDLWCQEGTELLLRHNRHGYRSIVANRSSHPDGPAGLWPSRCARVPPLGAPLMGGEEAAATYLGSTPPLRLVSRGSK